MIKLQRALLCNGIYPPSPPVTLEKINRCILKAANNKGMENGRSRRFDAKNVASNIHYPSDSSLLWDSVRVLCRITQKAKKHYGIKVCKHTRTAKKYSLGIKNAKNGKQRKIIYRTLVRLTNEVIKESELAGTELEKVIGDPYAKGEVRPDG